MIVLGIVLGIILFGLTLIVVGDNIQKRNRKSICKSWKVGDKLILCRGDEYYRELEKNNEDYAILEGWDLNKIYINCGDDTVYQVNWSVMSVNKSDTWRKNYENAKKVMGCDPRFPNGVVTTDKGKVNGKPIETMTEIECEVQLKLAIENEDYTLADKLRKRMEKFR